MKATNIATSVVTSSGVRFGQPKVAERRPVDPDLAALQQDFAQECPAYGLPVSFFKEICLSDSGETLELIGLNCGFADLQSDDGSITTLSYPEAVDGMLNSLQEDYKAIPAKVALFNLSEEVSATTISKARDSLRKKMSILKRSKEIYNGNMEEVVETMRLPLYVGWSDGNELYEFVSYREELDHPFILECLDKVEDDPSKYKEVSFRRLLEGIRTYAEEENDLRLLASLQNVIPPTTPDDGGAAATIGVQATLFDFFD